MGPSLLPKLEGILSMKKIPSCTNLASEAQRKEKYIFYFFMKLLLWIKLICLPKTLSQGLVKKPQLIKADTK